MFERRLTFGSAGNFSVKVDDGWLMTPTNVSLGELDPARLSKLERRQASAATRRPRKASCISPCTRRAAAGAVVHLHSTHSAAVTCLACLDPRTPCPRSPPIM